FRQRRGVPLTRRCRHHGPRSRCRRPATGRGRPSDGCPDHPRSSTPVITPVLAASADARHQFASFDVPGWVWAALVGAIVVMLLVDLLAVHRKPHEISLREAMVESSVWIALGLLFGLIVLAWQGGTAAGEYYAGYLIEKSLSID